MNPLQPDHAEEDFASSLDTTVPSRGYDLLPMVGLGGSAGSIPALRAFFSAMPADSGMAFVVIVHLSPTHESSLAELLQRVTKMPVLRVGATCTVEANHVYVIPPGHSLAAMGPELRLSALLPSRGQLVAVDLFFRTLADTYGPHAVAIVLSGADSDGSVGIRRIKERGGLTIAQLPEEAEHASMPRAAIATSTVDWVLPVAEMPARILEYGRLEARVELPPEGAPPPTGPVGPSATERSLQQIVTLLGAADSHDFTRFDRLTLIRRIGRRMQMLGLVAMDAYRERVQRDREELGGLERDLLASVSNFFRDSHCFEALEAWVPALFLDTGPNETVRVWVPACATGEEAYSIAILFEEQSRRTARAPNYQIFATDLSERAIRSGREGVYPPAIAADVSEERLARFFTQGSDGYRVRPEIREHVLFAVHDFLTDAPFSRIDLVSCRNALISLVPKARRQALEIFHFALRPSGKLVLGTSEEADAEGELFTPLDVQHRIYVRNDLGARVLPPLPVGVSPQVRKALHAAGVLPESLEALVASDAAAPVNAPSVPAAPSKTSRSELHFQLIERFGPPSVVVDAAGEILHMSQGAGRYLRIGGGEPSRNLLQLVDPMLRIDLRAALARGTEARETAHVIAVPLPIAGQHTRVDVVVSRADEIAPGCLLVVFHEQSGERPSVAGGGESGVPERRAMELDRELDRLKAHLRHTAEQHEASIEELKASNEELQAMNEELRAATEELETSREELQSINEELSTVNAEMKGKVDDIVQAHSDLQNLMGSISAATVFLDAELQVTLYTPSAIELFHLIPADIGRPLTDLSQRLAYPQLAEDARQVLRTLVPVVREVGDADGRWFLARVQPYRTQDERIAGVVLTFTDITEHRAEQSAREEGRVGLESQQRRFDSILGALPDTVFTFDGRHRFVYAGPGVARLFGTTTRRIVGLTVREAGCPDQVATRIEGWVGQVLQTGEPVGGAHGELGRIGAEGRFDFIFAPLRNGDGAVEGVVGWSRGSHASGSSSDI